MLNPASSIHVRALVHGGRAGEESAEPLVFTGSTVPRNRTYTRYDTGARHAPGTMQAVGEGTMALDLPVTAVAINFISDGDSITEVLYAPTFGCGSTL